MLRLFSTCSQGRKQEALIIPLLLSPTLHDTICWVYLKNWTGIWFGCCMCILVHLKMVRSFSDSSGICCFSNENKVNYFFLKKRCRKKSSLLRFFSLFVCCLSEGNKGKARALNKWNYGSSAVQSSDCLPSHLLSPHTYLAHISSVPCPFYKFHTSLHQLVFLPCVALHAKRIWVFYAERNVAWLCWIRGSRTLDQLWSSRDVRRDTVLGCCRGEEEVTDSQHSNTRLPEGAGMS